MSAKQLFVTAVMLLSCAPVLAEDGGKNPDDKKRVDKLAVDKDTRKLAFVAKISHGKTHLTLKHAIAFQRPDKIQRDRTCTIVFFTARPVPPIGIKKGLLKKDPSIVDFFDVEKGIPEYLMLTLNGNGYVKFHCRVNGKTLNVATNKISDSTKVSGGRVKGKLDLLKPTQFFDEEFQFKSSFDLALISNNLPSPTREAK